MRKELDRKSRNKDRIKRNYLDMYSQLVDVADQEDESLYEDAETGTQTVPDRVAKGKYRLKFAKVCVFKSVVACHTYRLFICDR